MKSGTNILFHGDPHGEFSVLHADIERLGPDAVILMGDQMLKRPLEEELEGISAPIYWIHGNHDKDKDYFYDHLYNSPYPSLDGRVTDIQGVPVAGLGGVFREKVWYPPNPPKHFSRKSVKQTCGSGNRWRGGEPLKIRDAIFPDEYEALAKKRAEVLVIHEAPDTHEFGHEMLSLLAQRLRVKLVVHGHHHKRYEATLPGGIRVLGLGERDSEMISF